MIKQTIITEIKKNTKKHAPIICRPTHKKDL